MINDKLSNPLCGISPRLLALAFSIFMLCNFELCSTALRNCSTTWWLLILTANIIFSFKAQHTRTLSENEAVWNLPYGLGDPHAVFSSFFRLSCSYFVNCVHALPLSLNTLDLRFFMSFQEKIRIWGHLNFQNIALNESKSLTHHKPLKIFVLINQLFIFWSLIQCLHLRYVKLSTRRVCLL